MRSHSLSKFLFLPAVAMLLAAMPSSAQEIVEPGERPSPGFGPSTRPSPPAPGRYIVYFQAGTTAQQKVMAALGAGASVKHLYSVTNGMAVVVPNENAVNGLRQHPLVTNVVADRILYLQAKGGKPPGPAMTATQSTSGVQLVWSYSEPNLTGFTIERCVGVGCNIFATLTTVGPAATSYSDTAVVAGTTYGYRMFASFNKGPDSEYSAPSHAVAGGAGPPPPDAPALNVTDSAHNFVDLGWNDVEGEDGYEVYRCTGAPDCTPGGPFVGATLAGETTFTDSSVAASTAYRYGVVATGSGGSSGLSNIVDVTTAAAPPGPPPTPTGLTVTSLSNTWADLKWNDVAGEEGYEVFRCSGLGCTPDISVGTTAADVTSRTASSLLASTTYRFGVIALHSTNGNSGMSNIVEVTTAADPVDPPPNPECDMFSGSQQQIPLAVQRAGLPTCASNGEGIGVAIVDTGLDFGHPDLNLAPDNPGVTSFNALDPGTTCQDLWSHGTHVGGIVAALDNDTGIVGVASNATLYCVKVGATDAGEIFESDLFAGLEWVIAQHDQVDPPIKVVNISSGGPAGDPTDAQYQALITQLYNLGIVVVTSAGNDETMEVSQMVPAGFSEVISVAGTIAETGVELCGFFPPVQADTASSFTTDGGVTVSAIAEERNDAIVSGFSCLFLLYGTLSTTLNGNASRKLPTPTQLAEARGTSFAAPVVAGIAARIMQRDLGSLTGTSADVEAVRAEIEGSADRIGVAPLVHPWGGPGKLFPDVTPDGVMEGIAQAP